MCGKNERKEYRYRDLKERCEKNVWMEDGERDVDGRFG